MRISHRYRFIFFANPKTGSSTVRHFLDPYSDVRAADFGHAVTPSNPFYAHMHPEEAERLFQQFGWDFNGYTKFVLVRNPWSRLVSFYEHLQGDGVELPNFTDWLYAVKPHGAGGIGENTSRFHRYGTYSIEHFIKGDDGHILVDKVIRLEDIDEKLVPFLVGLRIPLSSHRRVSHENSRRPGSHYTEYYNGETAAYVRYLYRYDIVNYGYEFGQ